MRLKEYLLLTICIFCYPLNAQQKDTFFQQILSTYENSFALGYEVPARYVNLNTDSIFLRYSQNEFNAAAEDLYYYYEEVVSRMSEEEKNRQEEKADSIGYMVKDGSLKYEIVFMKNKFRNLNEQKDADSKFDMLLLEAENAVKNNETVLSFRYKDEVFTIPRHLLSPKKWKQLTAFTENYIKELDKIKSSKQYPLLKRAYSLVGQSFNPINSSEFGEECLLKAAALPTNYYFDRSGMQALEILGIYYRNKCDIQKSDKFFLSMLTSPDRIVDRETYDAVALCQLGINYIEKNQPEKALELFLLAPSLEDKKEDIYFGQNNYFNISIPSTLQLYARNLKKYSGNQDIKYDTETLFAHYASLGFVQNAEKLYWFYNEYIKTLTLQEKQKELDKIAVLARKQKSELLMTENRFLQAIIMPVTTDYEISLKDSVLQQIVEDADKKKDKIMKLRAISALFNTYSDLILSYQNPVKEFNVQIELAKEFMKDKTINAFKYAYILSDELDKISEDEYPFKRSDSYALGRLYAFFGDTDRMIPRLEQALTEHKINYFDQSNLRARILLGRYYQSIEKKDIAHDYFHSVLQSNDNVKDRDVINAIALANLGMNYDLNSRNYAVKPISKLIEKQLSESHEYFILSDIYASLLWYYLESEQLKQSEMILDSIVKYENHLDPYLIPDKFRHYNNHLYRIKYYIEADNLTMVPYTVYQKNMQDLYRENVFNSSLIREAELNILFTSNKIKSMEIEAQKKRNILTYIFLIVLALAFIFIFALYRKNKNVNKALVAKNKDWAKRKAYQGKNETTNSEKESVDDTNLRLMKEIEDFITEKQLYKDPDLTLELLAKQMNMNRNYLSKAINATTGQNFSSWLNEYKVKEVIRIISDPQSANYSIEAIGELAGFGARSTFYNVFKKSTGLSPADFRKNSNNP